VYWQVIGWLRGPGSAPEPTGVATALAGAAPAPATGLDLVVAVDAVGAPETAAPERPASPMKAPTRSEAEARPSPAEADVEAAREPGPLEAEAISEVSPVPVESLSAEMPIEVVPDGRLPDGNRFDVICLPIIDWHFRFQRPQQLMCRFADAGHRVFYVTPWIRTSGPPYEISQSRPNVYELSLRGPELNVYADVLDDAALEPLLQSLEAVRRDYGLAAAVVVAQLPFWSRLATELRERFTWPVVYDCMDHHAGFSTNRDEMLAQESRLLTGADLVITTSASLEERARESNPNVLLLRNGCDFEHFAGAASRHGARPVIGYYGAIADWFDSDLVADLAERRPEWDFVLVGDTFTADVERLRTLTNVRLVGEKPYSEIPQWLRGFDVAILPFKRSALTEATNPVKAYEILAAGKPLVSVPLPEVVLLGPLVRLASDAAEFDVEIARALEASDWRSIAERRSFARENTWELRWATLSPRVRSVFPKVSIVVVTYNNLDLTRQCLESLYARTEWPNFEVIVVDNASSDGSPDYLREAATSYPDLKVFLNPQNFGFARASNAGLQEASGEYLVLLNNDTVVSRGWLTALIRHLQRDPRIGIVGPVTNAIGNEAMVPVGYKSVDRMPRWVASFVRDHDGEEFDIPMLAMFCVAMRRSTFETVGLLDERFGVGMFEDDDYSQRVRRAGYRVVCAQDSFVHHWMKAAFSQIPAAEYQRLFERNRRLFEEKWGTVWTPHSGRSKEGRADAESEVGWDFRRAAL
jgi:GT2 family glycosyltransferase